MDMAPGAQLYCIKVDDELDLENAAAYCRDNGIRIANHSVGWVNASYLQQQRPDQPHLQRLLRERDRRLLDRRGGQRRETATGGAVDRHGRRPLPQLRRRRRRVADRRLVSHRRRSSSTGTSTGTR
jgi:hypothetical protein